MKYEIKKLSFGDTWSEAIKVYRDNFFPLVIISFFGNLPYFFLTMPQPPLEGEPAQAVDFMVMMVWLVFMFAISVLSTALILEFVSKRFLGKKQTANEYLGSIGVIFPRIIGLAVVSAVMLGVGFVMFIIPGIFLGLALSVAVPVLMIERREVLAVVSRSLWLTIGKKGEIFGYSVIVAMISFVIDGLLSNILSAMDASQIAAVFRQAVMVLTQVLLAPLSACLFLQVYFNIRVEKEGFSLEKMEVANNTKVEL
ncbi:MAG: hypothetical protein GY940_36310 [bacterium]|nr:hypothetical protein [bacterium]